jgi:uncharacterized protein (TIGR02569 family)
MAGLAGMMGPPPQVLAAFGVAGSVPVALDGGQGTSWRAGDLVLKPSDADVAELAWRARIHLELVCDGFRLARPRTAADGSLRVDGWCASEYLAGAHEPGRWSETIEVGDRFHRALDGIPRPRFLDDRTSAWAIGDRVAWGEISSAEFLEVRHLRALAAAVRPVAAPSQIIHGDLCGNVLFHEELAPAIVDFSPYWRPACYASAIVVADALLWQGADRQILDEVRDIEDFGQYLLRALIFRLVSEWLLARSESRAAALNSAAWHQTMHLACGLAAKR